MAALLRAICRTVTADHKLAAYRHGCAKVSMDAPRRNAALAAGLSSRRQLLVIHPVVLGDVKPH